MLAGNRAKFEIVLTKLFLVVVPIQPSYPASPIWSVLTYYTIYSMTRFLILGKLALMCTEKIGSFYQTPKL